MNNKFQFQIVKEDKKSGARLGIIHTAHGDIQTPSYVSVGTQASVKGMTNEDLKELGTQVFFVNTYHMYLRPGVQTVEKLGGLHKFIGWDRPLMTDSAGFQVFSLAKGKPRGVHTECNGQDLPLVRITEDGVMFRSHLDGSEHFFTPEKSIESQIKLGADIMIAFDECTTHPATEEYSRSAMERTHRWALRCLAAAQCKLHDQQALYGVIQGGIYRNLREESAKFMSEQGFDGLAIGGVAVGESKEEMEDVLDWVVPYLPNEKPRHLLGVGEIDDIFTLVEHGMDTFDCVMPSRLGRMGHVLVNRKLESGNSKLELEDRDWKLDITKAEFAEDEKPLAVDCQCFVCKNYKRAYINHLFRTRELLAYRLATYHNLFFLEKLVGDIRASIKENSFTKLKEMWL